MATRDPESGLRNVFGDGKGGRFPFRDKVKRDGSIVIGTFPMTGIEGPDLGRNG